MADRERDTALRRMFRMVWGKESPGLTDGELLRRFAVDHDEAAFETLLWRHGPMVLNTCRRLLGQLPDAEDAFQAVFLVLCRKAGSITKQQSVGSWLYKVAYRICLRARAAAARRPATGREAAAEPAASPAPAPFQAPDLAQILDEELNRLPEKYRSPLVLHYLQGKTVEQTARELGWRPGTVSGRLARGKELLRARLVRRGVTLTISAVAGALGGETGAETLPPALVRAAVRAGMLIAAQRTILANSVVSPRAADLARSALRSLAFSRLQLVIGILFGLAAVALGAGALLFPAGPNEPPSEEPAVGDRAAAASSPVRVDADGDPLPQGAVLRLGSARLRHAGKMSSLSYSADGSTLIAAGKGVIRTWDARTGQARTSTIHRSLLFDAVTAVSPDGQTVAKYAPTPPGNAILLSPLGRDVALHSLEVPGGNGRCIAFSKDGQYLAAGGDWNQILLWKVATSQEIRRLNVSRWYIQSLAFSPDGEFLVALDTDHTPRIWDLRTGEERPLPLPRARVSSFAIAGSGQVLALGHGDVSLWDLRNGRPIRTLYARDNKGPNGRREAVQRLAISSDGKIVASVGNEGTIRLWDTRASEVQAVLQPGNRNQWLLPAFSPDGRTLAVGGGFNEIRLWDVDSRQRILVTEEPDLGSCFAAVSPDGCTLATAGGKEIRLWDARSGRRIDNLKISRCTRVAFSPDGARLVLSFTGAGSLSLWDLTTKKQSAYFTQGSAISPDQEFVAGPGWVWRAQSKGGLPLPLWSDRSPGPARLAVFSPDGQSIAWTKDGAPERDAGGRPTPPETRWCFVTFRETQTGKEYARIHCPAHCWAIAFSPDGRTVAVAGLNYIQLWDLQSQQMVHQLEEGPEDFYRFGYEAITNRWCRPIAFAHDGSILAAAVDNHSIGLWDTSTGRELAKLSGHAGRIVSLAFSPDGRLVSGSEDTTALVWEVTRKS